MVVSLMTRYLGLELGNPLVASAVSLNAELDHLRRLEDAGVAAVVLPSLFQEQLEAEQTIAQSIREATAANSAEASGYFAAPLSEPLSGPYGLRPTAYLELIQRARRAIAIPVIASLNGSSDEGWTRYARLMEEAGAQAIELNISMIPIDPEFTGEEMEDRQVRILERVRSVVRVPVAVKLLPFASAPGNLALRLVAEGASGLVLFNRLVQPEIDPATLRRLDRLHLSTSAEMQAPLLWLSLLAGRIDASLAASTGVETPTDVIRYLLAGADVVMTSSAILRHGPDYVGALLRGLRDWVEAREYASLDDVRGLMSWMRSTQKDGFGRAATMKILGMPGSWT